MVFSYEFSVDTRGFCDIHDITPEVKKAVDISGISNGLVCVFVNGSTAGVTTCEYEPGLVKDLKEAFERLAPQSGEYHHNMAWGDGNGFSHVRASLLGAGMCVPLSGGRLILGMWQQIILVDFDNRKRRREVIVQIVGE